MFVHSVVRARNEVEAAWMAFESKPGTRLIAGGTDLMLQLWRGQRQAASLIDLRRAALDAIEQTDTSWRIGATATVAALAAHDGLGRDCPQLRQAAEDFASRQIRNMATVGGNIGNASPAADLVTPLMALDARVVVRRGDDQRSVPLAELFEGPGKHRLTQQELIVAVEIPKPARDPGRRAARFVKLGFRGAQIIAVVNLAVELRLLRGVVENARLALGAVAPTVVRAPRTEVLLRGARLDRETIVAAADTAVQEIAPIDDVRASASYRRRAARNLVRLVLEEARLGG